MERWNKGLDKKSWLLLHYSIIDGIVKSRHSRENGNPENSNYMKILDSCLRRNDRQLPFQTFYETIIILLFQIYLLNFGH